MYFCKVKTNKKEHTKKALLTALEKSLGVVTSACKIAKVGRTTFYQYPGWPESTLYHWAISVSSCNVATYF